MARPSKLVAALPAIHDYLDTMQSRIISIDEMIAMFYDNRERWNLAQSMRAEQFLEAMGKYAGFNNAHFIFRNIDKHLFFPERTLVTTLVSNITRKTYLSHYSSLAIHDLTDQIPKIIYVTNEQSAKPKKEVSISQVSIDAAFRNKQRESNNVSNSIQDFRVVMLDGKYSNNLGVLSDANSNPGEKIRYTDLERTLIDIAVRPNYSGGIYEVLEAYKRASKKVSINKLAATLKKLDYIYPYHQSIGFYLEKAGIYSESQINILRREKINYKFYLAYGIEDMEYSEKWQLYYPKGM